MLPVIKIEVRCIVDRLSVLGVLLRRRDEVIVRVAADRPSRNHVALAK